MDRVEQGWIGIDAGKGHHYAVLIDRDGQRLLSRRVINDEPDLVALIDTVQEHVVDPVWAIDLARARSHGHGIPAGELLWKWIESWMQACPPYVGPQWTCGQEAAVRLIALTLALAAPVQAQSVLPRSNGIEAKRGAVRMRVTALTDSILRISMTNGASFPEDASWAVSEQVRRMSVPVRMTSDGFSTGALGVRIDPATLQLSVADTGARTIVADAASPVSFDGARFTLRSRRRRSRQHAVFSGDPAFAGVAPERRDTVLDARRADHFRLAGFDQD